MENQKPQPFNNLTKGGRTALQELSERDVIVITKADQVSALVIKDVKDYIRQAESQLKNKDNYDRLKYDPKETHNRLINSTIERFKEQKMMKEKVFNTEKPRTLKFYLQLKIHKKKKPWSPSSANFHNSKVSRYADYHLQHIAKEIPSCVKDFIKKLNQMDVRSLYTNRPNNEGIKTVKEAYDKYPCFDKSYYNFPKFEFDFEKFHS